MAVLVIISLIQGVRWCLMAVLVIISLIQGVRWCLMAVLVFSSPPPGEGTDKGRWTGREDRSLANTFPFTLNEDIGSLNTISRLVQLAFKKIQP